MKQAEELANIKSILEEEELKYNENEEEKSFTFEIERRNIKVLVNKKNKVEARILHYDGLNPLCHVRNLENLGEGQMCLDNQINAYEVDSFKKKYINSIKEIILEKNFLEDSFNELEINIYEKNGLMCFQNNLNKKTMVLKGIIWNSINSKKIIRKEIIVNIKNLRKIKWDGFRFRKIEQFKKIFKHKKINYKKDILIIFVYKNKEKWLFVSSDFKKIIFVSSLHHPQTMINKTGAIIKKNSLVIMVGLGSLGSEIFERFRLAGYVNFVLIDYDSLNADNDYRWAYPSLSHEYSLKKIKAHSIAFYFQYLRIIPIMNKMEDLKTKEINLIKGEAIGNENLIFINATAEKSIDEEALKLWLKFSREINFENSVYKLSFLEENGLVLHTFSINYEKENPNYFFYGSELEKFLKYWEKRRILKWDRKYIYEQGCIGETQIYAQNSVKKLTINASHIWNNNYDEYTKINLLPKLIREKKEEWTDYYRKYTKENNYEYNEEIEIK